MTGRFWSNGARARARARAGVDSMQTEGNREARRRSQRTMAAKILIMDKN